MVMMSGDDGIAGSSGAGVRRQLTKLAQSS